jgi:RNA polymerase sigma factor (sigma-70 family)
LNSIDITLLRQGHPGAFRALVEQWQHKVYNTVLGLVQHEADAQDITQEVFVQVYRGISSFKGESQLSTWLYRIAVNAALEHERKKNRQKRKGFISSLFGGGAELKPDFHHPGVAAEKKEQAAVLFSAVKQLPESQRIAFTLVKTEGLSYSEVAAVLNNTESGVDSLVQRARQNLKKKLAHYYKENFD